MKNLILSFLKELANAPGEFQILPEGKIEINGEEPVYLDEAAARESIEAFRQRGNDMVIDYEHQTLRDVQAPAAGWIKQLTWKGKDGLWALVDWTKRAKDYLESREYRFFSPVILYHASDRKIHQIFNVALTNSPLINNLEPIIAKAGLDAARTAQEERSRKYSIGVKDGGHVTKPGEWANVPDDEFLDPVNYRYPCPDVDQTRSAASYWGQAQNQEQYNSEERAKITARLDKFRQKFNVGEYRKEATSMIEKLRKLLGLAADAAEEKVTQAVEAIIAKCKTLETAPPVVACKEVLAALGAKETAGKDEVIQLVAALKSPGDVAKELSLKVAELTTKIATMEQEDLVALALKEGKTSPDELDKWGRNLAKTNPEQFKLIVLARAPGSIIPLDKIQIAAKDQAGAIGDEQKKINEMCGVSEDTFKKYNK